MQRYLVMGLLAALALPPCAIADHGRQDSDSGVQRVRQMFSGWSYFVEEADSDGVPSGSESRAYVVGEGKGGRVETSSQADIAPWDGVSFCNDGKGVELYYVSISIISRYASGDLLYSKLASSPPSAVCFDYTDETVTATFHVDVVGGTGKFANATGALTYTFSGGPALLPGHTGVEGNLEGTVVLSP
jgi:hypothetical protein